MRCGCRLGGLQGARRVPLACALRMPAGGLWGGLAGLPLCAAQPRAVPGTWQARRKLLWESASQGRSQCAGVCPAGRTGLRGVEPGRPRACSVSGGLGAPAAYTASPWVAWRAGLLELASPGSLVLPARGPLLEGGVSRPEGGLLLRVCTAGLGGLGCWLKEGCGIECGVTYGEAGPLGVGHLPRL